MDKKHLKFAVLSTDIVIFRIHEGVLQVKLMEVNRPPYFVNILGFPGGLILPHETALESAQRILKEKAGITLKSSYIEQLRTYSEINRDPRGRVVSVGYIAVLKHGISAGTNEYWLPVHSVKKLAYDHNLMLKDALKKLKELLMTTTIVFEFLDSEFTIGEMKKVIEIIMEKEIDKRNFYKKLKEADVLKNTGKKRKEAEGRPAELYTAKPKKLELTKIF